MFNQLQVPLSEKTVFTYSKLQKPWILFVPSKDYIESIIIHFYHLFADSFNLLICLLVLRNKKLLSFQRFIVQMAFGEKNNRG